MTSDWPLPFNVTVWNREAPLPFTQPADVVMPPLPTMDEAAASFAKHYETVESELLDAGHTPIVGVVFREAFSRLTTAEQYVLNEKT